jgi:hypothetical protein
MWESVNNARRSQRMAALCAICILVALVIPFPIGAQFADWMNETMAPAELDDKYELISAQGTGSEVTFVMETTSFRDVGSDYGSYYVWANDTGITQYNNVTHTAGAISVAAAGSGGHTANTTNIDSDEMIPRFEIYFDYTAKEAYADNLVRIHFVLTGVEPHAAYDTATVVTLSVGDVTLYTETIPKTSSKNIINTTFDISTNDLRRAIISDGDTSYFYLEVVGQDPTGLSFAGSEMECYAVSKLMQRDDGILIASVIAVAIVWLGIFVVQPRFSMPFGKKNITKGGF